jgi:hypothetical protein
MRNLQFVNSFRRSSLAFFLFWFFHFANWVRCYPHPPPGKGGGWYRSCYCPLNTCAISENGDPCTRTGTRMDQERPQRGNLKSTARPTAPKRGRSKSKRAASARHQRPCRRDRKRHGGRNVAYFAIPRALVAGPIAGGYSSPHSLCSRHGGVYAQAGFDWLRFLPRCFDAARASLSP